MYSDPGWLQQFMLFCPQAGVAMYDDGYVCSPLCIVCHFESCGRQPIRLKWVCNEGALLQHLRSVHASNPDAELLARLWEYLRSVNRWATAGELDRVVGVITSLQLREGTLRPDRSRADFFRPPPPVTWHPAAWWLNSLLVAGVLSWAHVLVQIFVAFVTWVTCGSVADSGAGWRVAFPTLAAWAAEVSYCGTARGYRLLQGEGLAGRRFETHLKVNSLQSIPASTSLLVCVMECQPWMAQLELGTVLISKGCGGMRLVLEEIVMPSGTAILKLRLRAPSSSAITSLLREPVPLLLVRERDGLHYVTRINLALPPLQAINEWELPATHQSATHWPVVASFLLVSTSTPGVPLLQLYGYAVGCTVVPYSECFDERPLRQTGYAHRVVGADGRTSWNVLGAVHRDASGHWVPFTADVIAQLNAAGPAAVRRAMIGARYVKEVLEVSISTLDSQLALNTHTSYQDVSLDEHGITRQLRERLKETSACLECLLHGKPCNKPAEGGPCSSCIELGVHCTYAQCVHSYCDQAPKQRVALEAIATDAQRSVRQLPSLEFLHCGFALLHLLKGLVAALRKYSITSRATGELSISMLRAIACSDTPLARTLTANIRSDVLLCRDRHSDDMCWY